MSTLFIYNNNKMETISSFDGDYAFLSNFYPAKVFLDNVEYNTVEHAYQAAKTISLQDREIIRQAYSPSNAKKLGRQVTARTDWEEIKRSVMKGLVMQKFRHPELREKLMATGDAELIEGNWWGDTYWGVCKGVGQNHLGRILMYVRALENE